MTETIIDLNKPLYVSMESFSSLDDMVYLDDNDCFETPLIVCDEVSRNNTLYGLEDTLKSLKEDYRIVEAIENNVWFGESEHPHIDFKNGDPKMSLQRMMEIDPDNISHRIDRYWAEGNAIKGIVQLADPKGPNYKNWILKHKSNMAMSIRSFTPNVAYKENGPRGRYQIKKYRIHIATFDMVRMPGLKGSRAIDPDKFAKYNNKNMDITVKNFATECVITNVVDELRYLSRKQGGMEAIADLYGFNIDNADMTITADRKLVVSSESGILHLPLHDTIVSKIMS